MVLRDDKKVLARRWGDRRAAEALAGFTHGTRVTGLTNGAFSLLNMVVALLEITGPAHVVVSTWSAGVYDITDMRRLLNDDKLLGVRWILDRSFPTRQKGYASVLSDLFASDKIRTTDTHAKFVLLYNDDWKVVLRSSMNLNSNRRCENFDVDDSPEMFEMFMGFVDDLFEKMPAGLIEDRDIVDPVFDDLFPAFDFDRIVTDW